MACLPWGAIVYQGTLVNRGRKWSVEVEARLGDLGDIRDFGDL
jgi:hypothetical protein